MKSEWEGVNFEFIPYRDTVSGRCLCGEGTVICACLLISCIQVCVCVRECVRACVRVCVFVCMRADVQMCAWIGREDSVIFVCSLM